MEGERSVRPIRWVLSLAAVLCLAALQGVGATVPGPDAAPEAVQHAAAEDRRTLLQAHFDPDWSHLLGDTGGLSLHGRGISPLAGAFSPPHTDVGRDTNGNGQFNFLEVDVEVTVDAADVYVVAGILSDATERLELYDETVVFLGPGSWAVALLFSGQAINASGIDGPYGVFLGIFDSSVTLLDTDAHTTREYGHLDFETPGAVFAGPHSDSGRDSDGDGRFNVLDVDARLTVNRAATYAVLGLLYDGLLQLQVFSVAYGALSPGPQTLRVPFAGYIVNASGIDGPYFVEFALLELGDSQPIQFDFHMTGAYSHSAFEEFPRLRTPFTTSPPTIDGVISPGEWAGAQVEDLSIIPGNTLPAFLMTLNDGEFLYIAYDAVGDTTMDPSDAAGIAFDTGNDGIATTGGEDQFVQFGGGTSEQAHLVFDANLGGWVIHDSPYNPGLPNHAGLASSPGFGASPRSAVDHRAYEFQIPLVLLGLDPWGTIGFFGGSNLVPAIADGSSIDYSVWPAFTAVALHPEWYGDLTLETPPDSLPPTISITTPDPDSVSTVNSITVTWTAGDEGIGIYRFQVTVGGRAPVSLPAIARSYTATGLPDGAHTITVTAFDRAGNSQSDSRRVTVDVASPSLVITAPGPEEARNSTTVLVTWLATDAGTGISRYELRLDGGPPLALGPAATSQSFAGLSEGHHEIGLTAFDAAGHQTTETRSFIVDTTDPEVTIGDPRDDFLGSDQIEVRWSATDPGSGLDRIFVSLDSGAAEVLPPTATSFTFGPVADGPHTIHVTAVDLAGNRGSEAVDVTIDTVDPIVAIVSPAAAGIITSSDIIVSFTAEDARSGVDRVEIRIDGGPAQVLGATATSGVLRGVFDGSHEVTVTVHDRAGNAAVEAVTVRVDTAFLSPTGPYGYGGIGLLAAILIGTIVGAAAVVRLRRKVRPPGPAP